MEPTIINSFRDKYFFLSNFYPCQVEFEGMTYPSVEAAFQAAKTLDVAKREKFQHLPPEKAKAAGRKVLLREDWEEIKEDIMYQLLLSKFSDPSLKSLLEETSPARLVEGNTWHDNYFGVCSCPKCAAKEHKNRLGALLQKVRAEYRNDVLTNFQHHEMTASDLEARNKIRAVIDAVVERSKKDPATMNLMIEEDSLTHLVCDGCGDQYIVMAQEAEKRGFQRVIDIGCDLGWACLYFQAHGITYQGVECEAFYGSSKPPCEIFRLRYPVSLREHISYDRETTLGISSLCVGFFKPVEAQYAQLAKDFRHVLITLPEETKHLAERYFSITYLDRDVWYMEAKD